MSNKRFFTIVLISLASGSVLTGWLFWRLGLTPIHPSAGNSPPVLAQTLSGKEAKLTPEELVNVGIYERLSPSVVNITTIDVSYDFFLEPVREEGTGSGSIVDLDGHIVTNHHVVESADRIQVTLADKSKFQATVTGVDEVNDLAVLKINAPQNVLKPIPIGSSKTLKVGQKVFAIGNPFGLTRTMSCGIISSLGRSIKSRAGFITDDVIQTDAAINPGNSGGPLIDSSGQMIGITTSIFTTSGGNIGIGFAIPAATVVRVINDLIQTGKVRRPWVGIYGADIDPEMAQYLNLPAEAGVLVAYVEQGSSADLAGIRSGNRRVLLGFSRVVVGGDFIIQVNQKPVSGLSDLTSYLLNQRPGEKVNLLLYRDGKKMTISMELVEKRRSFRL